MRKFGILAVSITLCLSVAFIFPHSGKSFSTFIGGCSACHDGATLHDGHNVLSCNTCHNAHCDLGIASVVDSDNDGIADDVDNCPSQANGPEGGTCPNATMGEPCVKNGDCGCEGYCSMDQEDTDEDGIGDVCDN